MRQRPNAPKVVTLFLAALFAVPQASGISVGQIDDFENGGLMNWMQGNNPGEPSNELGGPGGKGDRFLLNESDGVFVGGRQTVFNRIQWAGDYITAGVTSVTADVRNLGASELHLRLAFDRDTLSGTRDRVISSEAIVIAEQLDWTMVEFSLDPADLILLSGDGSIEDTLADVADFRVFHGVGATFPGQPLISSLGIDNITAVGGPQLPGDFDKDGDVDGDDFLSWQSNFGTSSGATQAEGDADGDGDVDGEDFLAWQSNFGAGIDPPAAALPEPASLLAAIFLAMMATARRR